MKLNIQLFGGRGASSSKTSSVGSFKTSSQLRKMREKYLKDMEIDAETGLDYEILEEKKKSKFVAYNLEDNKVRLENNYNDARTYADEGGQILNLQNDKIYEFKPKTMDEYIEYVGRQVRAEARGTKDKYGL